jgi:hypothetical protein
MLTNEIYYIKINIIFLQVKFKFTYIKLAHINKFIIILINLKLKI